MKSGIAIVVVVTVLLLGTAVVAQTGGPGPPAWYTVEQGTASGGGYRLTNLAWPVCGTASGGGYRLGGPIAPASSESGCCCVYLPVVLKSY